MNNLRDILHFTSKYVNFAISQKYLSKKGFIVVFRKVLDISYSIIESKIKCFILKNWYDFVDIIFILATPPKVKLMASVNRSLKILRLLSETLFPKMLSRHFAVAEHFIHSVCMYVYIYTYIHNILYTYNTAYR